MEVGVENYSRGVVYIGSEQRVHAVGQSAGDDDRPGVLVLQSVAGVEVYLWATFKDGVAELRCLNRDPGADEAPADSKVVVRFP